MRCRHGGTRDGVGGAVGADPGREDAGARGEQVNDGTVVGKGRNAPVLVNSTDGEGVGSRGGRGVGSVHGVVTGGHDGQDTGGVSSVDGVVEGRGEATT